MTTIEPDDVHAAKDTLIQILTNALIRAEAECAAWRRANKEREGDDAPSPSGEVVHGDDSADG